MITCMGLVVGAIETANKNDSRQYFCRSLVTKQKNGGKKMKLHPGYIIIKNPKKYLSVVQELKLFSSMVKNDFSSTPTKCVYTIYYTDKQLEKILYWKKLIQHFVEFHLSENVCNIY